MMIYSTPYFKYDESQGIKESYDDITELVNARKRRRPFNREARRNRYSIQRL